MEEFGAENALSMIEKLDSSMNNISKVIRGIDKRMSMNLRMIGTVAMKINGQTSDTSNPKGSRGSPIKNNGNNTLIEEPQFHDPR
jgi:hypothetical protein